MLAAPPVGKRRPLLHSVLLVSLSYVNDTSFNQNLLPSLTMPPTRTSNSRSFMHLDQNFRQDSLQKIQEDAARYATTQQFVTEHEYVTDQCGDEAPRQLLTCNSSEGRDALAEVLLVVIQPGTMFAPLGL
jgi:hypothetical protein